MNDHTSFVNNIYIENIISKDVGQKIQNLLNTNALLNTEKKICFQQNKFVTLVKKND